MRFIVITSPDFLPGEAALIARLFDCGLDTLHLRKPGSSVESCARLLDAVPAEYHGRIVTHDHFTLCRDYGLQGVHLNSRNPAAPGFVLSGRGRHTLSASCHSVAEVLRRKPGVDYVFMSPVFDSISKQGYGAAYTDEQLDRAAADGTIDDRVIALGGVSLGRLPVLRRWRFGGAAFLGDVWNRAGQGSFSSHARALAAALHRI